MADQYTRTGNGFLTKIANAVSYIPIVGGFAAWPIGMIDTVFESFGWLIRGKFASAATAFTAGLVSNSVNAFTSTSWFGPSWLTSGLGSAFSWLGSVPVLGWFIGPVAGPWIANATSGLATGQTLGGHARVLTENLIGGATGMLGVRPVVLQSYTAGMGYMNDYSRPGMFAQSEMGRRGVSDMQAYHAQKLAGESGAYVPAGAAYQGR
jgi:hypothetical protein